MSRKGRRSLWPSRNRWPRKSCRARPYQLAPFRATSTLGRRSHSSCCQCWRRRHFFGRLRKSEVSEPASANLGRLQANNGGSSPRVPDTKIFNFRLWKCTVIINMNLFRIIFIFINFIKLMNNTKTRFFFFGFPKRSSRSGPTKKSAPEPPLKIRLCNTVCKLQYCYVMIRIIVNYYRFVRKDRLVWFLCVHNCIFFKQRTI